MKLLVVADKESDALWTYYDETLTKDVDLILSCGDLDAAYLEFLVTMTNCPLLYVRGNHDDNYAAHPPEGCEDIDGRIVTCQGLKILGLGGCVRYHDGDNMYTEKEMRARLRKLYLPLRRAGALDLMVTHAPVKGYGDLPDHAHQGFQCFDGLLTKYRPQYLFHGHVHREYSASFQETLAHPSGTTIINACGYRIIEINGTSRQTA